MKPISIPKRTPEQRAEEEAIRRQHTTNPILQRPAGTISQQSFTAMLSLLARFKALRESHGLTLAEVAERMGIDPPALSRLETGKVLNPTLATLHKWAEALGEKLNVGLGSAFRLVDNGWNSVLADAIRADHSSLRIVCPFIKKGAVERLLDQEKPNTIQVITRFNLQDFCDGVSDIAALRLLLGKGAAIRGVRNLHAKLYLLGERRAIVTSANLIESALLRNHELGFVAEETGIVARCRQYFDDLWGRAGSNLSTERLAEWEGKVANYLARGAPPMSATGLRDEGMDAGVPLEPRVLPPLVEDAGQGFVKFFGLPGEPAPRSRTVLDEVDRTGCHWACTYPKNKRPRSVRDGAVLFMGRFVKDPRDLLIFGRGIGMHYEPGRDDATDEDIKKKDWKETWPHYIRVHHAEFIAGDLANGISLNELMDSLKSDAFASTQRHARRGDGNTDPQRACMQKSAMELAPEATAWLNDRLQRAFVLHGKLPPSSLAQLDWPEVPLSLTSGVG